MINNTVGPGFISFVKRHSDQPQHTNSHIKSAKIEYTQNKSHEITSDTKQLSDSKLPSRVEALDILSSHK